MSTDLTDLCIDSLRRAFASAFNLVREENPTRSAGDFAASWVSLVASGLDGVRVTCMPPFDIDSPPLRFGGVHRIEAESFVVARGGMRGGPGLDVLLQIWFDTEDMLCSYGVPLAFRKIESTGRIRDLMWSDLQDVCRSVNLATPSGRIIFLSGAEPFETYKMSRHLDPKWLLVDDMQSFAGRRLPPKPVRGRRLHDFCLDLASGWIGDPALSGLGDSRLLEEFLSTVHVAHVLRIKIVRDAKEGPWRPVPLPL